MRYRAYDSPAVSKSKENSALNVSLNKSLAKLQSMHKESAAHVNKSGTSNKRRLMLLEDAAGSSVNFEQRGASVESAMQQSLARNNSSKSKLVSQLRSGRSSVENLN